MSGKAYSMKEMKGIVDYLTQNKHYKEIKGRKMWMDFANTRLTQRTWQSLKETFLKRILPDIHNPYYKLTMDQIRSFRQGYDVQEREKNKLEIQTISEDSNSNAEIEKADEERIRKILNEEKPSGEDIVRSKVSSRSRASVDTVILDNCYENAEDIQRVLDSPVEPHNADEESTKSPSKSLRDLITYSEPLTPMLQEVLHDFDTDEDSDDDNPKMQIIENEPETQDLEDKESTNPNGNDQKEKSVTKPEEIKNDTDQINNSKQTSAQKSSIKASEAIEKTKNVPDSDNTNVDLEESDTFAQPRIKSLRLRKKQANGNKYVILSDSNKVVSDETKTDELQDSDNIKHSTTENVSQNVETSHSSTGKDNIKLPGESIQLSSNSTTDTVLPNNQEALQYPVNNETKVINDNQDMSSIVKNQNKITRKRAKSQEMSSNLNLKRKIIQQEPMDTRISMSDTDITGKKSNIGNKSYPNITNGPYKGNLTENNYITVPKENNEISSKNNKDDVDNVINASQINPCLQSVSLYAEQLMDEKRRSKTPDPKVEQQSTEALEITNKTESTKRIVILSSRSDSDSNATSLKKVTPEKKDLMKSQRDKVLANVFGFTSGAGTSKRRGSLRKNSMQHYYRHKSPSDSSSWTSESDCEYVSPPHGRRNRHTRKYLKPKSARIYSLEADGGLFVMYGKKIYPLVRDGKSVKNYLTYNSDSESNEEDNYWKQKYNEVKNKITELEKLIENKKPQIINEKVANSPLISPRISTSNDRELPVIVAEPDSAKEPVPVAEKETKNAVTVNKTVKITFAKNNKEVQLEGHWSQLHPVLAEVVDIFHKDTEKENDKLIHNRRRTTDAASDKSSLVSIADDDVHEKVNKIETEIFKEIEEKAAEEEVESKDETDNNITKRKRVASRSRTPSATILTNEKQLSPNDHSPKKKKTTKAQEPEPSEEKDSEEPQETKINLSNTSQKSAVSRAKSRTPKKKPKEEQPALTRLRKSRGQIQELNIADEEDDDKVRYMFPPNRINKKSTTTVGKAKGVKKYSVAAPKIFVSPDLSFSDSTQGYLDSDVSPPNVWRRKKRKLSNVLNRNYRINDQRMKLKSNPNKGPSSDSNSSLNLPEKHMEESTLKSEAYRSDSYQLLMQHRKNPFKTLEKIDEDNLLPYDSKNIDQISTSPNSEEINTVIPHNLSNILNENNSSYSNTEYGNSSNVSLPLSPELSIVEKLSVSKELLNTITNQPTLNEIQANVPSEEVLNNKYLISQVDVSMPLMQQTCGIHASLHQNLNYEVVNKSVESESVLKLRNSVNIDKNETLTESLNTRLTNLLLESAKKMTEPNAAEAKETRAKRCSTPRKRKNTKPAKQPMTDPIIEEHMESCSYGGRKSCPPSIHVIECIDTESNIKTNSDKAKSAAKKKPMEKKKKDIIKVKILRPKDKCSIEKVLKNDKSTSKEQRQGNPKPADRKSIPAGGDSGINDSESLLASYLDDSIDLIHNHSETCLHANECVGDSVEYIETSSQSIITLNSNSAASYDSANEIEFFKDFRDVAPEKVQGVTTKVYGTAPINNPICENTSETLYHSPISSDLSMNSIITEDLSEENAPQTSQTTKWYLLSEDDTNSNLCPQRNTASFGFGSNLNKLFPITCAVPDLSTITEASKDNDSRKPTLELTCDSNTV